MQTVTGNVIKGTREWSVDLNLKSVNLLIIIFVITLALPTSPLSVYASNCSSAGGTGLTSAMIAHSNQMITGMVDASGCDVGVYVGPGVVSVVIANATITGANDHGIFVQDTSNVVIEDSLVTNIGLMSHPVCPPGRPSSTCIIDDKEIELVGTSGVLVRRNTVTYDPTDGGIAVVDDGALNAGSLGKPGSLSPSVRNMVVNNLVYGSPGGCDILVAAFNAGAGASGNVVVGNLALGSSPGSGPYDGQIVIATNGPNATVSGTTLSGNIIEGSLLPGIVVHANVPGSTITNTLIENNLISNNGFYPSSYATPNTPTSSNGTTGIALEAEVTPGMPSPPSITGTSVMSNTILNDRNGLWTCNTSGTTVTQLGGNATFPILDCHTGPSSVSTSTSSSVLSSVVPGSVADGMEVVVVILLLIVIVLAMALLRIRRKKT